MMNKYKAYMKVTHTQTHMVASHTSHDATKRIKVPTVILGADKKVFTSRRRNTFFRMIPENVMEISVAKSTHNDAQYPHMFKWKQWFGMAQSPKPKFQERFTAAMTTAVISITNGGDTGVAWKILTAQNSKGFIEPRRK